MKLRSKRDGVRMTTNRKMMAATIETVSDDEVDVILSTANVARDGHILEPQGCVLDNYRKNPIVLWQHDPEQPIGNCVNIVVSATDIRARIRFAPLGSSAKADEVRALVKTGVIRTVSTSFEWDAADAEPLDPRRPRGGQRIHKWEMLENSFVSVPADPGAMVTAREKELQMARKTAQAYKRLFNGSAVASRSMYSVANLAYLLSSLCGEAECAKFEEAIEGDASAVPAMLAAACSALAEAFKAMATEEAEELIADLSIEGDEGEGERDLEFIDGAPGEKSRAFRRLMVSMVRAGKPLSASNAGSLNDADEAHGRAMKHHRSLGDSHDAVRGGLEEVGKQAEGLRSALAACSRALKPKDRAKDSEKAIDRAMKQVDKATAAADKIDAAHRKIGDAGEDMHDSHAALGRSLKAAQRSVQGVLRSALPPDGEDDEEDQVDETINEEDDGERSAEVRRRDADVLSLSHAPD